MFEASVSAFAETLKGNCAAVVDYNKTLKALKTARGKLEETEAKVAKGNEKKLAPHDSSDVILPPPPCAKIAHASSPALHPPPR